MTLPQPFEGVAGTQRTDDLLSLDDGAMARRRIVWAIAHQLYRAQINASTPALARHFDRMMTPQPGDLVIETSRYRPDDVALHGFGILVIERTELAYTQEDWARIQATPDEDGDLPEQQPCPTDRASYVQYGSAPGDVTRWTNHSLVTVQTADQLRKTEES